MNRNLSEFLACPSCGADVRLEKEAFVCVSCRSAFPVKDGRLIVHKQPDDIMPSNNERPDDPDTWGGWRAANFEFLKSSFSQLENKTRVLDIGSGQSQFRNVLKGFNLVSCDIYPYPEVDVVCDATVGLPFKKGAFDAIHLSNVLEHIYRPSNFLKILSGVLKEEGRVVAMVPFMTGEHQIPYDFHRYTRYCLERLFNEAGLKITEFHTWGDPLQLSSQLGWQAFQELSQKQAGKTSAAVRYFLKFILIALNRCIGIIRRRSEFNLLDSALAGTTAHGYMVIARKRV